MFPAIKRSVRQFLLEALHVPHSRIPHISPALYGLIGGRRGLRVVDVGAHTGHFTSALARTVGVKSAILVEPLPDLALAMRGDADLRGFEIVQSAAGRSDGDITINYFPKAPYVSSVLDIDLSIDGMADIVDGKPEALTVPLMKLDTLLAGKDFDSVDVLKIDVQGFEIDVLHGAEATLDRTSLVYCEVSFRPVYSGSCTFFDVFSLMNDRNFILIDLEPGHRSPTGELLQADALFMRKRGPA